MTRDELEAAGLYECDACSRVYESEISLVWCCRSEEEQRRGIFRGID